MSSEFYFRLFGMVLFGMGGGWLGFFYASANGANIYEWSTIFALVGMLVGLILTRYLTVKPVRNFRKMLNQVSAKTLFSGMVGLIISLIAAGLLSFPLSMQRSMVRGYSISQKNHRYREVVLKQLLL